jgi:cation:H+ antiporter
MDILDFDTLVLAIGAIGFGTYLLVKGGDWTVDSAVYVARRYGISPLLIGFTVVAMGTSLPELIVSVLANIQGSPGIAIGNVLGSNIANIALVLGAGALISPMAVKSKNIYRDIIFMVIVSVLFAGLMSYGDITRAAGIGMVGLLIAYIVFQYKSGMGDELFDEDEEYEYASMAAALFFLVLGLAGIAIGAEFLVRGAKLGALTLGVPEAVVALSVVALGTSLPELSTSIIAARKGHSDIMMGNIVGSNVFNILLIMGVASGVKPIMAGDYAPQLASFDVWVTLAVAIAFALVVFTFKSIGRIPAFLFVVAYFVYNIVIYALNVSA